MTRPTDRKLSLYVVGAGRGPLVAASDLPGGLVDRLRQPVRQAVATGLPAAVGDDIEVAIAHSYGRRCAIITVLREAQPILRAACATKSLCGRRTWDEFVGDANYLPATPWLAVQSDQPDAPQLAAAIAWAWMLVEEEARLAAR